VRTAGVTELLQRCRAPAVLFVALASGCASGPSYLESARADAVRMAELRNVSELGCEGSKGEITHSETLRGPPPATVAYSVLVAGCGQRRLFVVQCAEGQGCYTGAGRPAK
jgi:hypothetical protein